MVLPTTGILAWGRFHRRFCALHRSFASCAKLWCQEKLLKSWAQGAKVGRRGAKLFIKSTLGRIFFVCGVISRISCGQGFGKVVITLVRSWWSIKWNLQLRELYVFFFFSLSLLTKLHCYDVIMYAVEIWGQERGREAKWKKPNTYY